MIVHNLGSLCLYYTTKSEEAQQLRQCSPFLLLSPFLPFPPFSHLTSLKH
jgi:hypothetical protein